MSKLSTEQALTIINEAIGSVAPELEEELATVDPDIDVWEFLELDSIDHMNVMVALLERTGVDVPDRDYARLRTLRALAEYLASATV